MNSFSKRFLMGLLVAGGLFAATQAVSRDERMAWWREARFGMFIHWGLYSIPGGEWKGFDYGKEMGGASAEWLMLQAGIPKDEYAALAKQFNPVKFNAREWVSLAKLAGMKYLIITAKHHDGFSLFDSKLTTYDIIDATPFKRDVIRELAGECRRQGIRFGVYYSQSRDWYNRKPVRTDRVAPTPEYQAFVKGQLRELLTRYGDIATVWFDGGDRFVDVNAAYGRLVRELQPRALINGRLNGGEGMSDYKQETDRTIPTRRADRDVETPMTLRDNWGYDRDENNWKSEKDILERLCLTVCRGGNMLLNVGPKPDGTICPEDIERLRAVERWMAVNGEAIYGNSASPFNYDFEWGSISQKPGRLYLHVMKWNPAGMAIHGLKSRVRKAWLLADKSARVTVSQDIEKGTATVKGPAAAPDARVCVIALEIEGKAAVDPAATGKYHWIKDAGVRLNTEKIARQKAAGWKPLGGGGEER